MLTSGMLERNLHRNRHCSSKLTLCVLNITAQDKVKFLLLSPEVTQICGKGYHRSMTEDVSEVNVVIPGYLLRLPLGMPSLVQAPTNEGGEPKAAVGGNFLVTDLGGHSEELVLVCPDLGTLFITETGTASNLVAVVIHDDCA